MKHIACFLLIAAALVSCTQNETTLVSEPGNSDFKESKKEPQSSQPKAPYLFKDEKLHAFSDHTRQDTFKLTVTGDPNNYQKARIRFQIVSHTGKVIYLDNFEGNFLIDYGILGLVDDPKKLTDQIRSVYIQKRLENFFEEKNFMSPAIKPDASFEEYHTDKALFEELKKKPNSIAFFYLLGEEDGRYIAYSEKEGKAVMFYNCC